MITAENKPSRDEAFTLIELLVVIAIIAILAALLLPGLALAKAQAQGARDQGNEKQMLDGWHMYIPDFADKLPQNDWGAEQGMGGDGLGSPPAGYNSYPNNTQPAPNWVSGWEQGGVYPGYPDNTNTVLLTDARYSQIGPYIKNPKIEQCSASKSTCNGYNVPLVRDISMSVWMGGIPPLGNNTPPAADTNVGFQCFAKLAEINGRMPGAPYVFNPSMALIFIDEKDTSIDDGEFLIQMTQLANIANIPASYHAGGCGLAGFGDGHAEIHKYVSSTVLQPPQVVGMLNWSSSDRPDSFKPILDGNYTDLGWLQKHATYSGQDGAYTETAIRYAPPN